jgi:hypothetical protein
VGPESHSRDMSETQLAERQHQRHVRTCTVLNAGEGVVQLVVHAMGICSILPSDWAILHAEQLLISLSRSILHVHDRLADPVSGNFTAATKDISSHARYPVHDACCKSVGGYSNIP